MPISTLMHGSKFNSRDLALPPYRVRSAGFPKTAHPVPPYPMGRGWPSRPGEGNTCVTSAWWWCLDPNSRRSDFFSRRGVICAKKAARRTRSELEGGSVKIIQKFKVQKGFMSRWDRLLRVAIGFCVVCAAAHAAASIVINEIHYNPDLKTEHVEFIELFNKGTNAVDLSGWYFSDGVSFTFPNGTFLAPGGYLVVAQDPAGVQSKFGASALGPWTGTLNNEGERIVLRNAAGGIENEVDYQQGFPWPTVGD